MSRWQLPPNWAKQNIKLNINIKTQQIQKKARLDKLEEDWNGLQLWFLKIILVHRAEKVVSDNPGLVDFAVGLVNPVPNLPEWQVKLFGKFKLQKNCNQLESMLLIKIFLGYLKASWTSIY